MPVLHDTGGGSSKKSKPTRGGDPYGDALWASIGGDVPEGGSLSVAPINPEGFYFDRVPPPPLPPPPPPVAPPSGGAGGGSAAAALEARLAAERAADIARLQADINRFQSQEEEGLADYNTQLGFLRDDAGRSRDEANRQNVFDVAGALDSLAGRGLSLSGVRAGAEGRIQDALLRALSNIDTGLTQNEDAISRAMQRLQNETAQQVSAAQAQIRALRG